LGRGTLAQAVGQGDLDLACHQDGSLEGCFCRQTLSDEPNAAGENAENHYDCAEKDCDLLLAQAHCRDRITDPPEPAKLTTLCGHRRLAPMSLVLHSKSDGSGCL
jgi:hypothetical protein